MKGVEIKRKGIRKKKEGDIKMGKDYKSYRIVEEQYGWDRERYKKLVMIILGGYLKGGIKY